MIKKKHFEVLLIPLITIVVAWTLSLFFQSLLYKDVESFFDYEKIYGNPTFLIANIIQSFVFMILNYGIMIYGGWIALKKNNSSIKDSFLSGALLGLIQTVLIFIFFFLMYLFVPIYKQSYDLMWNLWNIFDNENGFIIIIFVIYFLFVAIFNIVISSTLFGLGSLIANSSNKKTK